MKISIVTALFNRVDCIADAIASVQHQACPQVEHVVIDGASTDGTVEFLRTRLKSGSVLISEPDSNEPCHFLKPDLSLVELSCSSCRNL